MDIGELKNRLRTLAGSEPSEKLWGDNSWKTKTVDRSVLVEVRAVIERLQHENADLKKRLEIDPRHNYDGIDCRDTTIRELERDNATLRAELGRKASSLATVSNALSYAESQASEWRCKAGTLENENRRLKLDLEEARKDAERYRLIRNAVAKLGSSKSMTLKQAEPEEFDRTIDFLAGTGTSTTQPS